MTVTPAEHKMTLGSCGIITLHLHSGRQQVIHSPALPGAPMRASREALFMENTSRARYPHMTIGKVVFRR